MSKAWREFRYSTPIRKLWIWDERDIKTKSEVKLFVAVAIWKKKREPGLISFWIATTPKIKTQKFGVSNLVFSHQLMQQNKHMKFHEFSDFFQIVWCKVILVQYQWNNIPIVTFWEWHFKWHLFACFIKFLKSLQNWPVACTSTNVSLQTFTEVFNILRWFWY